MKNTHLLTTLAVLSVFAFVGPVDNARADAGHDANPQQHMSDMKKNSNSGMIGEGMLAMPIMNPGNGRKLFAEKGCVVCHSINGVGGEDAPKLDASTMNTMMDPFEFAAKMWRGAEAMVALQRDELGEPIELSGRELGDIIAFVHSHSEQAFFSVDDVPEKMAKLMDHGDAEEHGHEEQ